VVRVQVHTQMLVEVVVVNHQMAEMVAVVYLL
jgi:hypothetical protein